jgi:hypothetical protein
MGDHQALALCNGLPFIASLSNPWSNFSNDTTHQWNKWNM